MQIVRRHLQIGAGPETGAKPGGRAIGKSERMPRFDRASTAGQRIGGLRHSSYNIARDLVLPRRANTCVSFDADNRLYTGHMRERQAPLTNRQSVPAIRVDWTALTLKSRLHAGTMLLPRPKENHTEADANRYVERNQNIVLLLNRQKNRHE